MDNQQMLDVCANATSIHCVVNNTLSYLKVQMRELDMLLSLSRDIDIAASFEHHAVMFTITNGSYNTQVVPRQKADAHPVSV